MNSRIIRKTQKQMFVLVSGHICAPHRDTNMASPHKAYKFGFDIFPNISHINYRTDLIHGEAFCIFIFFHFPDSGLSVLIGLHFYFWWRYSKNPEFKQNDEDALGGIASWRVPGPATGGGWVDWALSLSSSGYHSAWLKRTRTAITRSDLSHGNSFSVLLVSFIAGRKAIQM